MGTKLFKVSNDSVTAVLAHFEMSPHAVFQATACRELLRAGASTPLQSRGCRLQGRRPARWRQHVPGLRHRRLGQVVEKKVDPEPEILKR